ncbi:MAG TPA: DUF5050 domain-containing protein [Candidatus Kurthia intestinigallinarum]|nr:DUF5050 domain-containing protein [Candidatus Kurthia intestinigallinarum]
MTKSKWLVSLTATCMLACGSLATSASAVNVNIDNKQDLEKAIEQAMENADSLLEITYTGADVESIYRNITPISMAVGNGNDEILGILQSVSTSSSLKSVGGKPVSADFKLNIDYFTTKAKKQQADATLKTIANTIKKNNKSQFDRVKAVNDYLVLNTTYGGTTDDRYTAYGLLQDKVAVCQGYATAAYALLKELGMEVRYVVGVAYDKDGNPQDHAWNKVKVDGKWYNLDVTWNDPVPNRANSVSHKYFLLSDKTLNKDHVATTPTLYPKATDTKYDFLKDTSSVAINGTMIYYANDKKNQQLYSYNKKTKKHKRLAAIRVQDLAYYNGKLYFSNYSNSGYLASIKTNDKSLKTLKKKFSTNVYINKNYVYYSNAGKKYKLKVS